MNATLDAVIGPLSVAADYVDKIAKGDIPARITDEYKGDFNALKNNFNTCIDAFNNSVEKLSELMGGVKTAADTINTGAKEIAAGNTNFSQRTDEQASSLEESAAAVTPAAPVARTLYSAAPTSVAGAGMHQRRRRMTRATVASVFACNAALAGARTTLKACPLFASSRSSTSMIARRKERRSVLTSAIFRRKYIAWSSTPSVHRRKPTITRVASVLPGSGAFSPTLFFRRARRAISSSPGTSAEVGSREKFAARMLQDSWAESPAVIPVGSSREYRNWPDRRQAMMRRGNYSCRESPHKIAAGFAMAGGKSFSPGKR